jgi:hypothetical protein
MQCFLWNEYIANKTAEDIISVMWIMLQKNDFKQFNQIKIWSDNCVSQNTCWLILFFYAFIVKTKMVKIYQNLIILGEKCMC